MNKKRPVNLNLFTIRFPIPAIISILHRISGFVLFLLIPIALWALSCSLNEQHFESMQVTFSHPFAKFICWVLLAPFCYHFVAGIRHLFTDIGIGKTLIGGRKSAYTTLIVSIILMILAGIWIW